MHKLSLTLPNPNTKGEPIGIGNPGGIPDGGIGSLENILQTAIETLFIFGIIFCLFVLIYSGWLWMTSSGDKQKIQQVKQRIIYAIVGLVLVFSAFLVINILSNFFGINIVK